MTQNLIDEFIQLVIMDALQKHPKGLTEKQLTKIINKKLKKLKKVLDFCAE